MSVPWRKRWKRGLRSLLVQGVVRLAARLPLRAALALGTLVGRAGWWLAPGNRRDMLASLAVAFPEKSDRDRREIARASLVHLAWLAAEVATLPGHGARVDGYVSFAAGAERTLKTLIARGRGLVFATGHVGNWELMARRVAGAGIPNSVIAKASHDPRMNEYMDWLRAQGGVTTLWREDPGTGRAMIRTFREGKALGILIDQDTRVQGIFVPFFGRPAYTPRAAGDLALRFKAPVVAAWCRRRGPRPGDGHEVVVVEVPVDHQAADREAESARVTAACTALLEGAIRERPAEWVWMHQRWKRQPEEHPQASSVPNSRELSAG